MNTSRGCSDVQQSMQTQLQNSSALLIKWRNPTWTFQNEILRRWVFSAEFDLKGPIKEFNETELPQITKRSHFLSSCKNPESGFTVSFHSRKGQTYHIGFSVTYHKDRNVRFRAFISKHTKRYLVSKVRETGAPRWSLWLFVWMTCWNEAETWTGSLTFVACEEAVVCWPLFGPGLVGDRALMLLHSPPTGPFPPASPSGGPEGLCWGSAVSSHTGHRSGVSLGIN